MNWYYSVEGRSRGPLSEAGLKQLLGEGAISRDTLVWHPGLETWAPLEELNPAMVERGKEKAEAQPAKKRSAAPPQPPPASGQEAARPGIFTRLFGWRKKGPE